MFKQKFMGIGNLLKVFSAVFNSCSMVLEVVFMPRLDFYRTQ